MELADRRIRVSDLSATPLQVQKICNTDAPGIKSTNSSVNVCNSSASLKNLQLICKFKARNLQVQGTCRQVLSSSYTMHIRMDRMGKDINSSPEQKKDKRDRPPLDQGRGG
jgi:hypothetical protein